MRVEGISGKGKEESSSRLDSSVEEGEARVLEPTCVAAGVVGVGVGVVAVGLTGEGVRREAHADRLGLADVAAVRVWVGVKRVAVR